MPDPPKTGDPTTAALEHFREQVTPEDVAEEWVANLDDDELAKVLSHLDAVAGWTRSVRGTVGEVLTQRFHGRSGTTSHHQVNITPGELRRSGWEDEALAKAIVREVVPKQPKAGAKVAKAILEAAQISYWRKKSLSRYGIDADEFSESSRGKPRVSVTRKQS